METIRMRKTLLSLFAVLSALGSGLVCSGQEVTPSKFNFYGYVANYMVFDTREVDAGTQDLFFFMPKDVKMSDGVDENASPSFRMLSLASRLGVNVSGYRIRDTKVSANVEGDFYCMNGSTATFRLRHAYMGILWDNLVLGDLLLNVGQTWHPMAADLPHANNVETGSPFTPFNWSPQIMAHWTVGKFTWTGGILYPMQYLPVGPVYSTNPVWSESSQLYVPKTTYSTTKSAEFNKYGMIPEVYLGVSFQSGGFLGRAGANFFSIMPRWYAPAITIMDESTKELAFDYDHLSLLKARMYAVSPFLFLQYTKGSFQIRAKSILAQAGDHLNLLSGYASSYNWSKHALEYTPMQDWASFISLQAGRKFQFLCMLGYMQQLGTTRSVFAYLANDRLNTLWLNTVADGKIQRAFRATPTLAYNLGKLTFSLEYNCTGAWFGEGDRNRGGLYSAGHWVLNHRIEQMVKFNF
jgi:hypothetical protein